MRDFEDQLESLTIRPFDDGRFVIRVDDKQIYDKDHTGTFPKYENDVKPKLAKRRT